VNHRSLPLQAKIRELHRQQQQEDKMMGSGGNPINYSSAAAYQQMLASYAVQQAALNQARNPYTQQAAAFQGLTPFFHNFLMF
jgi:hypothetical protein